ncbi:hypothetical protein PR202_gb02241 [Eleusine coracana subsp. coracana]|uniref:Late embryogenesis abundant protein LEA-2 subgroup domain-containing protein n=1 Tax=Eleusine coracana subsp. coracana TaxID=191504 RepID=A0AAV5DX93_ELECO|nr:hypothetical protein QOZ80_5BG0410070 [Eleusine coracana subsp. coracana]GJN15339.1 hypothetical protein PR202_gb02241 [Eleusine coracana subsp. coracana]
MADAKQKGSPPSLVVSDVGKGNKAKAKAGYGSIETGHGGAPPPAESEKKRCSRLVRWRTCCCVVAMVGAAAALVMLVLSLTILKVRDPTLFMESVTVKWFNVHLDAAKSLRINVTLAGTIAIRNPNYESMRFGPSATRIFVDGVPGYVGVGRAPPGEVPARGESRVAADLDVFVDRVGPAVVGEVLFGSGEVRLASRTAVDGRISVLGGLYGRRTVRVAMRCRVALRVSADVVVAGSPSCVADFAR